MPTYTVRLGVTIDVVADDADEAEENALNELGLEDAFVRSVELVDDEDDPDPTDGHVEDGEDAKP